MTAVNSGLVYGLQMLCSSPSCIDLSNLGGGGRDSDLSWDSSTYSSLGTSFSPFSPSFLLLFLVHDALAMTIPAGLRGWANYLMISSASSSCGQL